MTREKYLAVCEQMGEEVSLEKLPPEMFNFPEDVQKAIITFNKLGDRIFENVGYLGKDYVSVPLHIEILRVQEKDLFLETLLRLDERIIKKSAEAMQQHRKKIEAASKKK